MATMINLTGAKLVLNGLMDIKSMKYFFKM